ncbi:hypothetical protein GCM10022214_52020 [Actinomadura miaoliensis]|uniref:Uncharacterized protein n=2 Tax=Actinomadura miaoliensis TaxID=430685 RepID=A0ABP7WD64_9ACTN
MGGDMVELSCGLPPGPDFADLSVLAENAAQGEADAQGGHGRLQPSGPFVGIAADLLPQLTRSNGVYRK